MSSGRYLMRGRVFQGRAFATWDLANSGVTVVVANPTTRLKIVGTSRQRLAMEGTSKERLKTVGVSKQRLSLTGSSE